MSLDQARKKAMTYLAKAANQEDPQSNVDAQRKLKTIDELVEAYIENHAKKKKKTWKEDRSYLNRYILSKLSGRLAVSLVTADLEAIHSELGVDHPYGANDVLKVVRKMFNWGKVAGLVPRDHPNIVAGIVRFPERTRKRFVTTVEMPRLLQALEQEDNDYARHGIWLLLLMGLRSKELLKAKWEDIDWDMGTLFIGLTKNGEPLLAAHMRTPAAPTEISASTLLPAAESTPIIATENSVAHYRHYFRREDLYRLVWTSPVSEIAARLGVSDVGLAKLCRRAAIPIPGRGNWQRAEAGQPIGPPPLSPAPEGLPELLRIRGTKPASVHSDK
jgi:integrase